ncbi:GGDEF domain-containing protein [Catellatospora sp. NPDC049609]|uniref:GGDEF domain-containing protein n=1 Tax=Catellatospora sp. NPDC049609 TaxID=3155505 RepID=UPI00341BB37B
MSDFIPMIATCVAVFLLGRLTAARRIRRLQVQLADTARQLEHDPLTGLLNRRGLATAHAAWQQAQRRITLVFLDLDDFKQVNDTHGHHVGDQLLIGVARTLADLADIYGGVAARRSGDEFALMLPAEDGFERAVDAIVTVAGLPVTVTADGFAVQLWPSASAGACAGDPADDLDTLLHRADTALYHAKHTGRPYAVHRPGMAMPDGSQRRGPRRRDRREQQGAMR